MTPFLEFLVALLALTVLGAGVAGIAAVWFAVWLSGSFAEQDAADSEAATKEDK